MIARTFTAASALASVLALAGCGIDPSAGSIVTSPRVLAIVAEPPDARPGDAVSLRVSAGGTAPAARFEWTLCARPDETTTALPLSSFGQFDIDRACDSRGAVRVASLGTGTAVSAEIPTDATSRLSLLRAAHGDLPDEVLRRLGREVGIVLVAQVVLTDGRTTLRAYKRIYVTEDPARPLNRNPPPPTFTFAGRALTALNGDECAPADGTPIDLAPGSSVRLEPASGESAWLETYTALDSEGRWLERREDAFYDMYSTAGTWDRGRARMPDRNPQWTAPAAPGLVSHWLVVRDGRGGTSACHFSTTVRAP